MKYIKWKFKSFDLLSYNLFLFQASNRNDVLDDVNKTSELELATYIFTKFFYQQVISFHKPKWFWASLIAKYIARNFNTYQS